jgi:hypothetical protein
MSPCSKEQEEVDKRVTVKSVLDKKLTCPCCWSTRRRSDGLALNQCGHWFCLKCWYVLCECELPTFNHSRHEKHRGSHISTTTVHFGNYLPTCPHKDCNSVIDPLTLMFTLGPAMCKKFNRWMEQSMIDMDREHWSTCTSCSDVVISVSSLTVIRCLCKRVYCSNVLCKNRNNVHFPLSCEEFEKISKLNQISRFLNPLKELKSNHELGFSLRVKPCPGTSLSLTFSKRLKEVKHSTQQ